MSAAIAAVTGWPNVNVVGEPVKFGMRFVRPVGVMAAIYADTAMERDFANECGTHHQGL